MSYNVKNIKKPKRYEYKLINEKYESSFNNTVNSYLSRGWVCQGGVSIIPDVYSYKYLQAMIKIK